MVPTRTVLARRLPVQFRSPGSRRASRFREREGTTRRRPRALASGSRPALRAARVYCTNVTPRCFSIIVAGTNQRNRIGFPLSGSSKMGLAGS